MDKQGKTEVLLLRTRARLHEARVLKSQDTLVLLDKTYVLLAKSWATMRQTEALAEGGFLRVTFYEELYPRRMKQSSLVFSCGSTHSISSAGRSSGISISEM